MSTTPDLNDPATWGPDLPPEVIYSEKGWLQGAIVGAVAYGVDLTLFAICLQLLLSQLTRSNLRRNGVLLGYICLAFILVTLFMGSLAQYTQLAFIDNRNYPGGPAQYETDMFSIPIDEMGNISFVLANWLADAIIVWRCWVIYTGTHVSMYVVMFFPCLLFLGSFVMGILWLNQISSSSPWGDGSINWTIPYLALSLGLNVIITIAIVIRLFVYRRRISKVLGNSHGSQYTTIAAMVVESALIYALFAILFLVPFGVNNAVSQVFLQSLIQVQTASAFLIVFRVAQGKGWTQGAATAVVTPGRYASSGGTASGMQMGAVKYRRGPTDTLSTKVDTEVVVTRDFLSTDEYGDKGKHQTSSVV